MGRRADARICLLVGRTLQGRPSFADPKCGRLSHAATAATMENRLAACDHTECCCAVRTEILSCAACGRRDGPRAGFCAGQEREKGKAWDRRRHLGAADYP